MQIYYNKFSNDKFVGSSTKSNWTLFGYSQLEKLMTFLGYDCDFKMQMTLRKLWIYNTHKKDSILFQEGQKAEKIYFIIEGNVVCYKKVQRNEVIESLLSAGDLLFASPTQGYESFDVTAQANRNIRTLELKIDDLGVLFDNNQDYVNNFFDKLLSIKTTYLKTSSTLLHISGIDTISYVHNHFPGIFNNFSKSQIASFLGIHPASFSRLFKTFNLF